MLLLILICSFLYLIINKKSLIKQTFLTILPLIFLIFVILFFKISIFTSFILFVTLSFSLNDLNEREIFIFPFIILYIIIGFKIELDSVLFLLCTAISILFLVFCHITKENFIGTGDFYFIFPLALYLTHIETAIIPPFLFSNDLLFVVTSYTLFILTLLFCSSILSFFYIIPKRKQENISVPLTFILFLCFLGFVSNSIYVTVASVFLIIIFSIFYKEDVLISNDNED